MSSAVQIYVLITVSRKPGQHYLHVMLIAKRQGASRFERCKVPHSSLLLYDDPQSPRYGQHQAVVASTLQGGSLRTPRYHGLSSDRLTQKDHVQPVHVVPQSDVSKHGTLVNKGPLNYCLQGSANNTSGFKVSRYSSSREVVPADRRAFQRCQGLYESHLQKAHWDAGSSNQCRKDDPEDWTRTPGPGQGTAVAAFSPRAVNTQPNGRQPPGAPPMRPIPLPGRQEGGEYITYYGPGLAPGSWLTSAVQVDGVPKVLSRLDMTLPEPFA